MVPDTYSKEKLLQWFNDERVMSREGNTLTFDASSAGHGADLLAAKVEGLFIGFLLGKKSVSV